MDEYGGEAWTVFWTQAGRRHCIDFDREASALRMAVLLEEAGRELVYVDGPRDIDINPEMMAEIKRRVLARSSELMREAAAIASGAPE